MLAQSQRESKAQGLLEDIKVILIRKLHRNNIYLLKSNTTDEQNVAASC